MNTVLSKDGTAIAYQRFGSGPAVILVDGALCSRAFGPMPKLAPLLAEHVSTGIVHNHWVCESCGHAFRKAHEYETTDFDEVLA